MKEVFTPPVGNHLRSLFERHVRLGNMDEARYVSIGARIQHIRSQLYAHTFTVDELLGTYEDTYQADLDTYIEHQIQALEFDTHTPSVVPLRAQLFRVLADPLVCMPLLFSHYSLQESETARTRLTQEGGIYGAIGDVLTQTLEEFASSSYESEAQDLIGFANELTTLSLINRDQRNGRIALPALPNHDQLNGIDIQTYLGLNGRKQVRNLQVKSYEQELHKPIRPGIQLIGGIAIGNSQLSRSWPQRGFMQTARAITEEINGSITVRKALTLSHIAHNLCVTVHKNEDFIQEAF